MKTSRFTQEQIIESWRENDNICRPTVPSIT